MSIRGDLLLGLLERKANIYVKTVLIERIDRKNSLSKQLKDFNNSPKRPLSKIFLTSETMA